MPEQADIFAVPRFTTQGHLADGSPMLLRGKQLHPGHYDGARWPHVMTLEVMFPKIREDGLPSNEQHKAHSARMLELIDLVEHDALGVHVAGDTNACLIREWFYAQDLEMTATRLNAYHPPGGWSSEIYSEHDPNWTFYEKLVSPIRGDGTNW